MQAPPKVMGRNISSHSTLFADGILVLQLMTPAREESFGQFLANPCMQNAFLGLSASRGSQAAIVPSLRAAAPALSQLPASAARNPQAFVERLATAETLSLIQLSFPEVRSRWTA